MYDMYVFGCKLLDMCAALGGFLLYKPFESAPEYYGFMSMMNGRIPNSFVGSFLEKASSLSIGELLFSGAIISVLSVRAAKLFASIK